jgi:hypothetical protein
MQERVEGPDSLLLAPKLNNLAMLYKQQTKNDLAEDLYKKSLAITQKYYGNNHGEVATRLNSKI